MQRSLTISSDPIDEPTLIQQREQSDAMGAVITFVGVVRAQEGDQTIEAIDYEAHESMARHQFETIFHKVEQQWPVESIRLVHRIGRVDVKHPSLWVEVVAPHRGEAFAAGQFIIEEMKRVVPTWKKPLGGEA
jgi:molybdopterin synthase catalytic subunit